MPVNDDIRLVRDFITLMKTCSRFTNGQATIIPSDQVSNFDVKIVPDSGPYQSAPIVFKVTIEGQYGGSGSVGVVCKSRIYHPNIDVSDVSDEEENGGWPICLNILDEWEPVYDLELLVHGLLFLLHNPELSDPASPLFSGDDDWETFARSVRHTLRGGSIDGHAFDRLIADDETTTGDGDSEDSLKTKAGLEEGVGVIELVTNVESNEENTNVDHFTRLKLEDVEDGVLTSTRDTEAGVFDDEQCRIINGSQCKAEHVDVPKDTINLLDDS